MFASSTMSVDAEFHKRRITRLLQVREQSKDIAKKRLSRVKDERDKLISTLIATKHKEFNSSKQKSLKTLRNYENLNLLYMGEGHSNINIEDEMLKEWKNQRLYNARIAQQRSVKAANVLKKKKLEDESIHDIKSRRVLSKNLKKNTCIDKNVSKNSNFQQNYLETEDCINQSNNLISNNNRDVNTLDGDIEIQIDNPNSKESQENRNDLSHKENKTITPPQKLSTLQKELCNCNQYLNSEFSTKNEFIKDCVECNKHDAENIKSKRIRSSDLTSPTTCTLNIASQFIKNRKAVNQNSPKNDIKDTAKDSNNTSESVVLRDVIQQSRNLNSELINHFQPPIPDLPHSFQNYISYEKKGISQVKKDPVSTNNKKHFEKTIKFKSQSDKNSNTKHTRRKMSKCTKSPHTSPQCKSNIYKIKCYDHPNRFISDIIVDNDKIVKSMNKSDKNALQNALQEIEENKEKENILAERAKVLSRNNHHRGEKAIEQMKIENDYKKLLDELDILVSAEREKAKKMHITESAFRISQSQDNIGNQYVLKEKIDLKSSNKTNRANFQSQRWASKKSTLNVTDINACSNDYPITDPTELSKQNSDSSQSIILSNNSSVINNVNIQKNQAEKEKCNVYKKTDKTSPKINKNTRRKKYFLMHENSSEYEEYSNTTESQINVTQKCKSTKISDKKSYQNIKLDRNISSSTRSSVSFQGFQITIEVKKNKKNSSEKIKPEYNVIQNSDNPVTSSNEASIKSTTTSVNKNVIIHRNNSVYNIDSSESTTYMSPPDKITTRFEDFCANRINNDRDDNNIKNVRTPEVFFTDNNVEKITMEEKCVGTSMIYSSLSNILSENKGVQVNYKDSVIKSGCEDPELKKYVIKLLEMSKTDLEKLTIDVSDISTPSSSIINMTSNVESQQSIHFKTKIEKLKRFIAENYSLLEELNMDLISKDNNQNIDKEQIPSHDALECITSEKILPKKLNSIIDEDVSSSLHSSEVCFPVIPNEAEIYDHVDAEYKNIPSPVSDKSILIDETIQQLLKIDLNNQNVTSDEFHKLLSESLNLISTKTQSDQSSNDSTSGEEFIMNSPNQNINSENTKSIDFIPILGNIPRPENIRNLKIPQIMEPDLEQHIGSNFRKNTRDLENKPMTPRELSTILEVDTPITTKNISDSSKNTETSSDNILNIPNISDILKYNIETVNTPRPEDNSVTPMDLISFISHQENISRDAKSKKSMLENILDQNFSDLSKQKILEMSNDQTFHTIMHDNSSSSTMTDFETWLKNNGMSWGISTLKKSQESLSSTSTSTKSDHVQTTQLKTDVPKLHSESEEYSELTTSSEDVLSKTLKLQSLLEKLNKLNSNIEKKKSSQKILLKYPKFDNSSLNLDISDKNSKVSVNSVTSSDLILTEVNVLSDQSKDKTQHRTSTPVQNIKLLISSSPTSTSQAVSNGLFSMGSDISSVKNLSNSNTSDDQNALTIPNISLKFKKLFDSNTSD